MKQMFRFIIRVQVAAIFSFCQAWDRLIPDKDYRLYYEADENIQSPGKTEKKFELAENFTQYLQRNNKEARKIFYGFNSANAPYDANVWSRLEKNFNIRKLSTTADVPRLRTEKNNYVDYESHVLKFSTKRPHVPNSNTINPNLNLFRTYTGMSKPDVEDKGDFQVLNLLEEPDGRPKAMRRSASNEHTLEFPAHEKSTVGTDQQEGVFNLQQIYNKAPPEELSVLKHIETVGNSSTTTKSFFLYGLSNEVLESTKENDTIISGAKSKIILNYTLSNKSNKKVNFKHKNDNPKNRRDSKTSIEVRLNDERALTFKKILNRENQIIDILRRQTQLLEQVARFLDAKQHYKEAVRTKGAAKDFEVLLDEVNTKTKLLDKGTNMTQIAVDSVKQKQKILNQKAYDNDVAKTTASTPQRMLPTVQTVIDETEVRQALKKNPYVQRILKMAKKKRTRYLADAAKY